jgi:uncharacterized membrane protein YeiB
VNTNLTEPTTLSPVSPAERIQSLDVIRGFALLGIFLMNVEFFNRAPTEVGGGIPLGLTGVDWFASWFVYFFVQGKFWTIFSLLFGMGFAIMLSRAEQVQRAFIGPYLRRILALATFGAAHYIFIWSGDILFSYAMGAGALLILLYGTWKPIVGAIIILIALAFIPRMELIGIYAGTLAFIGLIALYMRSERRVNLRFARPPLFAFIFLLLGVIGAVLAAIFWVLPDVPDVPDEGKSGTSVMAVSCLIIGALSAKYHSPPELRALRLGVGIYGFTATMAITFGAIMYLAPPDDDTPRVEVSQAEDAVAAEPASEPTTEQPLTSAPVAGDPLTNDQATAAPADSDPEPDTEIVPDENTTDPELAVAEKAHDEEPEKTRAEEEAEAKAEREKQLAERLEDIREETEVLSKGSYLAGVELNARKFPEKVATDGGMSAILIAMFLIGTWFVRSGVMRDTRAHLPLFRKLAYYGLPFGIGLGLLSSFIAFSHTPGDTNDGFPLASGLLMLGNLPACLGYVGMVVLMLHSDRGFSRISVLAPAGRMALTNYILQSVVSVLIFFGYGLGQWGMPRAWQLVYVVVFFALQVAFSRWWLVRYRYGPLEWLWRGFTYRATPAMRL